MLWLGLALAAAGLAAEPGVPAPQGAPVSAAAPAPGTEGASSSAPAPAVDVRVTLEPNVIPFHRQAKFSIIVECPADVEPKLPNMVDQFGGLAASNVDRRTEPLKNQRRRIIETYTLDPVFAKGYRIEPVTVTWGENQTVTVASPGLRVRDLTEEEKKAADEFSDPAEPATVPHPLWRYRYAVGGACAALVAAIVAALLWKRGRKARARIVPPPPAWEVAYSRLRELDERQLPNQGLHEPYYVELSDILRRYIEDRFHLRAAEQTTPEFLADAASTDLFDAEHQRLLSGFLRHCDRVKFARYEPSVNEMEQGFAFVLQFVDETKPAPEAAAAAPIDETEPKKESAA